MSYDYLIIGAGLFGSIFAYEATKRGKKCLVLEKRNHIGGNCYTENVEGINVHKYGAHIFHTSNKKVWDYVQQFVTFNRFTNSPVAVYKDELYSLPFNMLTFNQMWGVITPEQAQAKIQEQIAQENITEPKNLEEQAISLVGRDVYEKLIKGYTEKQWGRPCTELPPFIIKRLPVRYTYDNNYFNDIYQGIPIGGYTAIFEKMLEGIEVHLNTDFFANKAEFEQMAKNIVFTGMIDEYFDFQFGRLEYRSLKFDTKIVDKPNYQGNAVVNYTESEVPFTRIIEHKHFEFGTQEKTVVTHEYSTEYQEGDEPYYPINDQRNNELYAKYKALAEQKSNIIFGGRLAQYKYFDMHNIIAEALDCVEKHFQE